MMSNSYLCDLRASHTAGVVPGAVSMHLSKLVIHIGCFSGGTFLMVSFPFFNLVDRYKQ